MTPTDNEKITKILVDMLMEFQKEQKRIQAEYDNGLLRLSELEENLNNYRETEDVDFKVFSPRKVSTLNEDKLNSMDSEMQEIRESNKALLKQLKYYTDKVEKLLTVQAIIDGEIYEAPENKEKDSIEELFNLSSDNEVKSEERSTLENDSSQIFEKQIDFDKKYDIPDMDLFSKQSLIDNLERISHRIEVGVKIIDNDLYRTKMELKSIKSGLDDVISTLK